jgi:glucose dehydrogenase
MGRRKPSHRGVSSYWSLAVLTIVLMLMSISLDVRRGVVAQAGQGEEQLGARVQEDILQRQTDDRQWVMPARDYVSTRYSGLDQINTENVKNLQLAWTFSTGLLRGHEAAPLVVNDTMYVVTPWPNILYALDLTQPGGPLKWK